MSGTIEQGHRVEHLLNEAVGEVVAVSGGTATVQWDGEGVGTVPVEELATLGTIPASYPAPYNLPALKSKLTRAKNSGDPLQIIAVCDAALDLFQDQGYPDCWHRWEAARNSATVARHHGQF